MNENKNTLLEARNLVKEFPAKNGKVVHAVTDINLEIYKGETLGVVGESGCGKSTLGRTLIGLHKPTSGKIYFNGEKITGLSAKEFYKHRRELQLIFQDPYASLDPRMSVRSIIAEPLKTYKICSSKEELTEKVLTLLRAVGVPDDFLYRYPHQFSGGQRQRIGIARAIALNPSLIICDEPVSALDVSVQSQVLNLLKQLQKTYGLTYMFISHDLSAVRFIADRVCVMFLGKVCEYGDCKTIFRRPLHPYTKFLIEAIPKADPHVDIRQKRLMQGELPSPISPPTGCRFHTRCPFATSECQTMQPELRELHGRRVACHHAEKLEGTV